MYVPSNKKKIVKIDKEVLTVVDNFCRLIASLGIVRVVNYG